MLTEGVEAAAALRERARKTAAQGRPAEAVRLLRQALRTLPVSTGDHEAIAVRVRVLCTLAYAEAEIASVADGLVHLGTAADLLHAVPKGPARAELEGLVHSQHALVLLRALRITEALSLFDKAVPLFEQARAAGVGDPAVLIRTILNRGRSYIDNGQITEAEQDMRRSQDLAEQHGLEVLQAKALGNLGDIAQLQGDIPGALDFHEHAERIFRRLAPDLVPRTQIDQARALLAAGLPQEAADHLDEALPELRKNRASQDLAEAELARAAAALLLGDLPLARTMAGAARARFARRGSGAWAEVAALTRMRADALIALAGTPSRSASPSKATALADRLASKGLSDEASMARMLAVRLACRRGSLKIARALVATVPSPGPHTPIDHRMLLRLCRAELATTPQRALAEANAGMTELSQVRDRMGGLDLLCGTAVHGRELGELAVGLVLSSGDPHEIFNWVERTRAQVYRYEPLPVIDDPTLASRVTELRSLARTMQQARLEGRPVAAQESRFDALRREVARLGWHTSPWGRPRPVTTLPDVITALADRALVTFVVHDDSLAAVVVSAGSVSLVRLGSALTAAETARQLHADLDVLAPDHLPPMLVDAVTTSASRRAALLDAQLISPLHQVIGTRDLVVVPTGELYAVPWGALPSLHGRPVVVAPSATAWLAASEAVPSATRVVLVGGPDLPESLGEVRRLRTTYPSAVLLEEATTETVLHELDGARLAHIAAHGVHAADNALFSRLELFDGPLFAHETARLGRPPEQVVLAACELALAHIRPGDEALGFAGALLASGSHTVVAAVNKVGDRAAALTMDDFHKLLSEGKPIARALAEATAVDPLHRPFVCFGSGH
ncbi:CHAT domain-containing protein [Lentzea tibetensis]|uniref:CHAT domain-containing protein n=1 Tax=Lentzea tibetensis TaxID=2591470 RepID=UPI001F194897|nr:CHAT domain-containing tetratricopeptide repeat protein [Lentzea tibetensis]